MKRLIWDFSGFSDSQVLRPFFEAEESYRQGRSRSKLFESCFNVSCYYHTYHAYIHADIWDLVDAYLTHHTCTFTIWDPLPDDLDSYHTYHTCHTYILTMWDLLLDAP